MRRRPRAYRTSIALVVAIALASALVSGITPARAQTSSGCLQQEMVCVGLGEYGGGETSSGTDFASPSSTSPLVWYRTVVAPCVEYSGPGPLVGPGYTYSYLGSAVLGGGANVYALYKDADIAALVGTVFVGWFVYEYAIPTGPGVSVAFVQRCERAGDAAPPVPPSAQEVWQRVPLPRPGPYVSPPGTSTHPGVTGLTTWLWGNWNAPVTARVELRGWVATASAFPVRYTWATGEGQESTGSTPGTLFMPVGHEFERRGDYRITLYVTWMGAYSLVNEEWGISVPSQFLGYVTIGSSVPYHVQEIRSLLVGP